ncbi:6348_t:CDS:2, partial [Cetraspora pellucida]
KALDNSESICRKLLKQLASYKDNESPFNDLFEPDSIRLLIITSHSAYLERLAKIYQYYITHTKKEISYINHELTLEAILILVNKTEKLYGNDSDKDSDEDYVEDSKVGFELHNEILKLEEAFDFDHKIFKENDRNNNVNSGFENV